MREQLTYKQKIQLLKEYYEKSNNPYAKILADSMLISIKHLNFFCIKIIDELFTKHSQFSYKINNSKIVLYITEFKASSSDKDKIATLKKYIDAEQENKKKHTEKLKLN